MDSSRSKSAGILQKGKRKELEREVLSSVTNEDEGKLWSIIRSLKVAPDNNSPNEVMVHGHKRIT